MNNTFEQIETYENIFDKDERKLLIAMTLKTLRLSQGKTQKAISDAIGLSLQTYSSYERGRNEIPAEYLVRLSYLYNVPLDVIMQRDNRCKDALTAKKEILEAGKQIDNLKLAMSTEGVMDHLDADTQHQLKELLHGIETLNKHLEAIAEKADK